MPTDTSAEVWREPKPSWAEVPTASRVRIEGMIGPVVGAETVWGGFGPTASFALTTASGKRFFCKGTHPGNTKEGHAAVLREVDNLIEFPELTFRFGAALAGLVEDEGWHLMVLEHVQRAVNVPPWTDGTLARVMALIAEFHRATPERAEAILRDCLASDLTANWRVLRDKPAAREAFAALFEDAPGAMRWLDAHVERLAALEDRGPDIGGPRGWVHMDIRSDNLIVAQDRVLLIDWPVLSYGPRLLDIAFFLPSLAGQGGPSCADGLKLYEAAAGATFTQDDVATAATVIAGFFAARAGEPEIPALPRLRWIQKLQLFPALDWLCDSLGIDKPPAPKPFAL